MSHESSRGACSSTHSPAMSSIAVFNLPPFMLQAQLNYSCQSSVISATIVSGSAGNLLDCRTTHKLHLPLIDLHSPVKTINGGPIGTGKITYCTLLLDLRMS